MNKKNQVIVFGASGFIGRNLIERLSIREDIDLHATYFTNEPSESLKKLNVKLIKIDLTNKLQVEQILESKDVVIQAAAVTTGIKDVITQPYIHVTDNAIMNSLIFRACFNNKIKHVIFFSCTTMYPNIDKAVKEDDFTYKIEDKYFGVGWTKVYIEKMCEFYSRISDTKFTAIRHSNIYGPFDKYDLQRSHVFGATVTKVLQSKSSEFEVWGDGSEKRDLLYISDLLDFVETILRKQKESFELINIGLGDSISIKNLVEKIISKSGKDLSIRYNNDKPTIKFNLEVDISKAKEKYGWVPKISLDEGILKTIDWYNKYIEVDDDGNIYLNER